MTAKTCSDCRFWEDLHFRTNECHRRSPQFTGAHSNSGWPTTCANDWCGEFQPKAEEKPGRAIYREY
jgi:hypothetical protein